MPEVALVMTVDKLRSIQTIKVQLSAESHPREGCRGIVFLKQPYHGLKKTGRIKAKRKRKIHKTGAISRVNKFLFLGINTKQFPPSSVTIL
jgi:hypothetical protein